MSHKQKKADNLPAPCEGRFSNWDVPGLSEEHQAEVDSNKAKVEARPKRPHMRVTSKEGKFVIAVGRKDDQADEVLNSTRFFAASGTGSNQFVADLLTRIMDAVKLTGDDERDSITVAGAVAMMAAIDPQNELEATMALQMVAANEVALSFFSRARHAEYLEHTNSFSNIANKAMRSFAFHAEALAKLRRGGEQVVKHVHVNDGGQAVIANNITTGGRG